MYPPVKQLDTRRRETEEWVAVLEARRIARTNSRNVSAGPRWLAQLAGQVRSLLVPSVRSSEPPADRPQPGRPFASELPAVRRDH